MIISLDSTVPASTTNSLSRKQRQIADRHALFLSTARKALHDHGFHQLSMDLVAEQAEYSKGTLYQHFSCKEEILIQLCNQTITGLHKLAQRATCYTGTHRERLLAFQIAHELWLELEPADVYMLQNLHTDGVLEKVEEQSRTTHFKIRSSIIALVTGVIQQAMDDGDLPIGQLNAEELVFGLWSMSYGAQLLRSYQIPLKQMGIRDSGRTITTMIQTTLDGLNWQPSMTHDQTNTLLIYLETEFFKTEIDKIRLKH